MKLVWKMRDLTEKESHVCESELESYAAGSSHKKLKQIVNVLENDTHCFGNKKRNVDRRELLHQASLVACQRSTKDGGNHLGKSRNDEKSLYVWPWMGIVANIPLTLENGLYTEECGVKLWDELIERGFIPLRVVPLCNSKGHTGYAVVEFRNDFLGFSDALRFDKAYVANRQGKWDYLAVEEKGDKLYCWVARDDDFHSEYFVGDHLRKNGVLKTIAQYQEEEKERNSKIFSDLTNEIEVQDMRIREVETKYNKASTSLRNLISQKDGMLRAYNEEMKLMQQKSRGHLEKIFQEHERIKVQLDVQRNELNRQEMELEKRETHNELETLKLTCEQQQNEIAMLEQKRANEKGLKLAEYHKREKEELYREIIKLEKKLDAKQALELELRRLRGLLQVVKHMGGAGEGKALEKLNAIHQELKEKEKEFDSLEALNRTLIIRERSINDELREARNELVNGLKTRSSRSLIGVKLLGELDSKTFVAAAKRKYSEEESQWRGVTLYELREDFIRNPEWHPFRTITVEDAIGYKVILDEEDKILRKLRNELGEDCYQSVTTALMELNEYNPEGRHPISELWNRKYERRATLKEGISHLLKRWRSKKREASSS